MPSCNRSARSPGGGEIAADATVDEAIRLLTSGNADSLFVTSKAGTRIGQVDLKALARATVSGAPVAAAAPP